MPRAPHQITEWQRLEGTAAGHLLQPLCLKVGSSQSTWHRSSPRWFLSMSSEGDSTSSLNNLFQNADTCTVKFLLLFRWSFQCLGFCLLPIVLVLGTTKRSLASSSWPPRFRHFYILMKPPLRASRSTRKRAQPAPSRPAEPTKGRQPPHSPRAAGSASRPNSDLSHRPAGLARSSEAHEAGPGFSLPTTATAAKGTRKARSSRAAPAARRPRRLPAHADDERPAGAGRASPAPASAPRILKY